MIEKIAAKLSAFEVFLGVALGGVLFGWRANEQLKRIDDLEVKMLASITEIETAQKDIRELQDGNLNIVNSIKLLCSKVDMQTNAFSEYKVSNMETYKAIAEEMKVNQQSNTDLVKTLVERIGRD